jgi:hypothetical protein
MVTGQRMDFQDPLDEEIKVELKIRQDEFSNLQNYTVHIVTWNVKGYIPSSV